ncbi:MAG: class I SAM-dependent methyltransferase [Gammaproteobacteria bacterium]|nr:class I SAM-dependent methyltransferase [Gammaproteobacteria bacterium]
MIETPTTLITLMSPGLLNLSDDIAIGRYDSRRLFYGRGGMYDGLDFINIDFFHPVVLITLYRDPGESWLLDLLAQLLQQTFWADGLFNPKAIDTIFVQKRFINEGPVCILWQSEGVAHRAEKSEHIARECGEEFGLSLQANRNHGFFLDMSSGRHWLRARASGKKVLNLFSYTCSFSVAAMVAGAESVVNIDLSSQALSVGRKNHIRNGVQSDRVKYLKLDILRSWGRINRLGPYDIVVIDPPSRQKGSFDAEKDYQKMIRRLPEFVVEGGDILACLNAPYLSGHFLTDHFSSLCPQAELVDRLPFAEGFNEKNADSGLKLFHYKMR